MQLTVPGEDPLHVLLGAPGAPRLGREACELVPGAEQRGGVDLVLEPLQFSDRSGRVEGEPPGGDAPGDQVLARPVDVLHQRPLRAGLGGVTGEEDPGEVGADLALDEHGQPAERAAPPLLIGPHALGGAGAPALP